MTTDTGPASERVPLSMRQKARLILNCVPVVSITAGFIAYFVFLAYTGTPTRLVHWVIASVAILLTGYDAVRSSRDLLSGVALVQEDRFISWGRSRRQGGHRYVRLATLGRLRASADLSRTRNGKRHRVTYSPGSRTLWRIEPLE